MLIYIRKQPFFRWLFVFMWLFKNNGVLIYTMEDIFKSGLLGLALLLTLAIASTNSNEPENSKNTYHISMQKETPIVDESNVIVKDKIKSKQDIHIPL